MAGRYQIAHRRTLRPGSPTTSTQLPCVPSPPTRCATLVHRLTVHEQILELARPGFDVLHSTTTPPRAIHIPRAESRPRGFPSPLGANDRRPRPRNDRVLRCPALAVHDHRHARCPLDVRSALQRNFRAERGEIRDLRYAQTMSSSLDDRRITRTPRPFGRVPSIKTSPAPDRVRRTASSSPTPALAAR